MWANTTRCSEATATPSPSALLQVQLPPVDDRKKVQEDVDKDRKHAIEAAIVRIMKSRKALKHQQVAGWVVDEAVLGAWGQLGGRQQRHYGTVSKVASCWSWATGSRLAAITHRRHLHSPPSLPSLPPPAPHLQLLVEVVQQLQRMFTPDVKVIKRAIDGLIDVSAWSNAMRVWERRVRWVRGSKGHQARHRRTDGCECVKK